MKIKGTRISYSLSLTPIVHTYPSTPPRAQAKIDKVLFTCTCDKEMPIIESEELACKKRYRQAHYVVQERKNAPMLYLKKALQTWHYISRSRRAVLKKVWVEGGCHFAASRCFCTVYGTCSYNTPRGNYINSLLPTRSFLFPRPRYRPMTSSGGGRIQNQFGCFSRAPISGVGLCLSLFLPPQAATAALEVPWGGGGVQCDFSPHSLGTYVNEAEKREKGKDVTTLANVLCRREE